MSHPKTVIADDNFANNVCRYQNQYTDVWHHNQQFNGLDPFWLIIVQQHKHNFDLWHQEDLARLPDASDELIASVKRAIDALNQQRNDVIAQIDMILFKHCFPVCTDSERPWNSETVGAIIDRLSIASLKIYHMREESVRKNASDDHRLACCKKLAIMTTQKNDLKAALQCLVSDISQGRKQHKIYHQFKMYNDPELNPAVYSRVK